MRLIFVRHAIAAVAETGQPDRDRPLTDKGRGRFARALDYLLSKLPEDQQPILWTSPALRAEKTARMIADAYGMDEMQRHEWIYSGDTADLFRHLQGYQGSAVLIVVGHEPMMSIWSERLSHMAWRYKKGGMACFDVDLNRRPPGRLRWQHRASHEAQGDEEPESEEEVYWQNAVQSLRQALKDVEGWHERFLAKPRLSRPPHQLRVSARLSRSLIKAMEESLDDRASKVHQYALKRMAHEVAELRKTDVMLINWRSFLKEEKPRLPQKSLSRKLREIRDAHAASASLLLSQSEPIEALEEAKAWADSLPHHAFGDRKLSRRLMAGQQKALGRIQDGMSLLDPTNKEDLHALRLMLKKYRNIQDSIGYPPLISQGDGPGLKDIQRMLGDICDTYDAEDHLLLLEDGAGKKLKACLQALREHMLQKRPKLEKELIEAFGRR